MPDEKHHRALGIPDSEHQLQTWFRKEKRGKTAGSRRHP
jgi:hypothetical protein